VREETARENGIPTLGYAEALHSLRVSDLEEVLVWAVTRHRDPAYHFQLFMSPDKSRVVACIGVSKDPQFKRTEPLEG
jgi:hypothetical protein